MWPPPTLGMSANQLRQLYDISMSSARHAMQELLVACNSEGHQWQDPVQSTETEGGEYYENSGSGSFSEAPSGMYGGTDVTYFTRICVRCGIKERRRAITQTKHISPFS